MPGDRRLIGYWRLSSRVFDGVLATSARLLERLSLPPKYAHISIHFSYVFDSRHYADGSAAPINTYACCTSIAKLHSFHVSHIPKMAVNTALLT
jgi:hypothetical protein